jgi:hypothetical protein
MAFNYAAKIQALLARAEHPHTPAPEAESCRARAARLMADYRIAEEDALATDPTSATPIERMIVLFTGFKVWEMRDAMESAMRAICRHAEVRMVITGLNGGTEAGVAAAVVGYEGDVRYAEYLWTSVLLQFSTRIDPVWDDTLPEAENIFRLRNAGHERRVIADRAWGFPSGKVPANRSKVQRIYVRECAARGVTPMAAGLGFQAELYRTAFAESFVQTLHDRLREARDAAAAMGGLPTLHGRSERVDEAFYTRYPHMRPETSEERAARVARLADMPTPEPCERCAKNPSGTCKAHPYRGWTKAQEARYNRKHSSASAYAGSVQGDQAAREVRLARGGVDRQNDMGRRADMPELDA